MLDAAAGRPLEVHRETFAAELEEADRNLALAHMLRAEWRCVGAFDTDDRMVGVAYGYRGAAGQWWHEQVRRGIIEQSGAETAERWLDDYFELTEVHVAPASQGRGIATEALRALIASLFAERGMHRVLAQADDRNVAVHRVLERVGMRCEARLVDADWFKGEWTTLRIYAVLASEWRA